MTPAEAYHVLQLEPGASRDQIEQQYAEQQRILREKRAKSPAPGLKAHYQQSLARLTAARDLLVGREDAARGLQRRRTEGRDSRAAETGREGGGAGGSSVGRMLTPAEVDREIDRWPRRLDRHLDGAFRALAVAAGAAVLIIGPVWLWVGRDELAARSGLQLGLLVGWLVFGVGPALAWWRLAVQRQRQEQWGPLREAMERREAYPIRWRRHSPKAAVLLLLLLAIPLSLQRRSGGITLDETPPTVAKSEAIGVTEGRIHNLTKSGPAAIDAAETEVGTDDLESGNAAPSAKAGRAEREESDPEVNAVSVTANPPNPPQAAQPAPGIAAEAASAIDPATIASSSVESKAGTVAALSPAPRTADVRQRSDAAAAALASEMEAMPASEAPLPLTTSAERAVSERAPGAPAKVGAKGDTTPRPGASAGNREAMRKGTGIVAGVPSRPIAVSSPTGGGPSNWPRRPEIAQVERARLQGMASPTARAELASAYGTWAEALREADVPGLALYALQRAAAEGRPDPARAAELRREFVARNQVTLTWAPTESRDTDGSAESAERGAVRAAVQAAVESVLASAPTGLLAVTTTEAGSSIAASSDAAQPVASGSPSPAASAGPQLRLTLTERSESLAAEVAWVDRARPGEAVPLLQLTLPRMNATLGTNEVAARVQREVARRREALLEQLSEVAFATIAERRRRARGESEEEAADLAWGWFAIWKEAGLAVPQTQAEQTARRALALPEAMAVAETVGVAPR